MHSKNISIRQLTATAADVPIYRTLRLQALVSDHAAFISQLDEWLALSEGDWCGKLENPVFVAMREDEPVGMMGLQINHSLKIRHRASIVGVFVREESRGLGVASQLLGWVEDYSRRNGISLLELSVIAENVKAVQFYDRFGFTKVGQIPGAILGSHDEAVDEIIMVRTLTTDRITAEYHFGEGI